MQASSGRSRSYGLPFAAALSESDDVAILTITGDVDMAAADDLRVELDELRAAGRERSVVDLTYATFVDSTTIGILIGAAKPATGWQRMVVVCPPALEPVFRVAGVMKAMDVRPTLVSALRD